MSMTDAPFSIRWFETLQIVAVMLGLINGFAAGLDDSVKATVSAVIVLTLTFFVSRRRKNWARWVLLVLLVLGSALVVWSAPALFAYGHLIAAIALGISLMNAAAVALLFTPESAKWLRTAPSSGTPSVLQPK